MKEKTLNIRIKEEDKELFRKAAEKQDMKVSEFVRRTLRRVARYIIGQ